MPLPEGSELDALADLVAQRLAGRFPANKPADLPGSAGGLVIDREQLPGEPFGHTRLGIAGIEMTQSVQHHGAAGPSYGTDNSVPLVALKPLLARVYPYVRAGIIGSDALSGARVTGELVLSVGDHVVYRTGPTRADGARVGPQNRLDRGLWDLDLTVPAGGSFAEAVAVLHFNSPLNFYIPARFCRRGRHHVAVRIWRVAGGAVAGDTAARSEYIQFLNVPAPRVCLVRVNWQDSAGNVTRPSDADMLGTLRLAERMLPWPYFEAIILSAELTRSGDFATPGTTGECNTAWSKLLAELGVTRIFTSLFGLGQIVFGLVPQAAIPAGPGRINSGCGGEAGGTFVGRGDTFAHELGHLYGRKHVAVPGDADNDPDYPIYDGTGRSMGEVGVDLGTSPPTLYDPSTTADIMSYRSQRWDTRWVSPYTYRKLLEIADRFQHVPADPRRVRTFVVAELRVNRGIFASSGGSGLRAVEIKRAFRIEAPGSVERQLEGAISPISVDLLDANQRILATHHCLYRRPRPCGCGCGGRGLVPLDREPYLDLIEAIEWPTDEVASLSFHRGSEPLATVSVGEPPRVDIEGPERREDSLVVRVRADHPRETPSIAVLFSPDAGLSWEPVALDPPEGELSVKSSRLPGGERCRFRAVATAELRAAIAETNPFELPRSPRRLHVITPDDQCGIPPGRIALSALVDTRGLGTVEPQEVRWHSNIAGEFGAGFDLTAELSEGRHELTVTAPDGLGGLLTERAIIIVGGRPRRAPEAIG